MTKDIWDKPTLLWQQCADCRDEMKLAIQAQDQRWQRLITLRHTNEGLKPEG